MADEETSWWGAGEVVGGVTAVSRDEMKLSSRAIFSNKTILYSSTSQISSVSSSSSTIALAILSV